jgi:hypothetical protein
MNCFAGCFQMAGTVITHRTSSFKILIVDWSLSSWRACSLKNIREWAKTFRAAISFPLLAGMTDFSFKPCKKNWCKNVPYISSFFSSIYDLIIIMLVEVLLK